MTPRISYRKTGYAGRYDVWLGDQRIGWVTHASNRRGGWSMYASTRKALVGEPLVHDCATRHEAMIEGLAHLRIYDLGRIVRLNPVTFDDEIVYLDCDLLKELAG